MSECSSSGIELRLLAREDIPAATGFWNAVIEQGDSFPDELPFSEQEAQAMFARQSATVCAFDAGRLVGVYILHPNHIGRCGHIANASFAVSPNSRGKGVGRLLVQDCLSRARELGFRGLQFNAVVADNHPAIALYLKLGFQIVGTINGGYRLKSGEYRDMLVFLKSWD